MAPKRAVAKRPRTGEQAMGDPTPSRIENWEKTPNNRYLFRNPEAYRRYAGFFARRPVSDCFRFVMHDDFPDIYRNYLKDHIDFWELQGLAFTTAPYTEDMTRIFYANLEFKTDEEDDRFFASGYLFGREFEFDSAQLNEYLGRSNEGSKVYINKKWPRRYGNFEDYHHWFGCWRNQKLGSLSSTELPALHRVLYMIINNILIPKRMIKTNVEMSGVFFLRHWLQKDIQINAGAIMLEHMHKVANSAKDSLPYAAFISAHIIPEAMDSYSAENILEPTNIANLLTSYGWVINEAEQLQPNPDDLKNRYILEPGAAPNQYVPIGEPLPNMPSGGASSSSAHNPSNQELMTFLTEQFGAVHTKIDTMHNDVMHDMQRMGERFTHVEDRLKDMDINLHNFWGSMEAKLRGKGDDSDDGEE